MNEITLFKRITKPAIVLLALAVTAISCGSTDDAEVQQANPITVPVATAQMQSKSASHYYSGTVQSERTVNMSTKVMGRVTQLDVEEGDFVKEGEVIIRIKDDNLQAQKNQVQAGLQEARAAYENAETNYNRIKALYESESATKKELDDIKAQYEMTKAKVQAMEARLGEINDMLTYTQLEAPFDGYVVSKRISEGDMAAPGQPLIAFEQEHRMKVVATVPESEINRFNEGDAVLVEVEAAGLKNISGTISTINPSGNRGSRQFMVEIRLPKTDDIKSLKSGMFARIGVSSDENKAVLVPATAVIERGQLTGIYTLNDQSEVVLRWVRLGETLGDDVEILSGLAPGEKYVSAVEQPLHDGQKVNSK